MLIYTIRIIHIPRGSSSPESLGYIVARACFDGKFVVVSAYSPTQEILYEGLFRLRVFLYRIFQRQVDNVS